MTNEPLSPADDSTKELATVLYDPEAEQGLISLAFRDLQHYLELVQAGVNRDMFGEKSPSRWLWQAFEQLYQPPHTELVYDDLARMMERGLSEKSRKTVEGYLDAATTRYVSPGSMADYQARLIRAYQRRLATAGAKLWHSLAHDAELEPEASLAQVEEVIAKIRLARVPVEVLHAAALAESRGEWYTARLNDGPDNSRIPFEQTSLNKVTRGGFRRGEFTVISAKPRVGKSAFMQRLAYWLAVHMGLPVLYVSVEMDAAHWLDRALTQETGIPSHILETGDFRAFPELVFDNLNKFGGSPLYLIDDPNATTESIRRGCEQVMRREGDLIGVFVDYAQRLGDRKKFAGVHDFMQHVSAELASTSRLYNCHVFAISRVKSDGETYGGMQLDYDVDNWIELKNDVAIQEGPASEKNGPATAFFKKQRYGVSGVAAPLYWNAEWVRFTDPNQPLAALEVRYDR